MPRRAKIATLPEKIKRCLRAKELGKKNYHRAGTLLDEIALELKPGDQVELSEKRKVVLEDQFLTKSIVWKPCGVRRYELKVIES